MMRVALIAVVWLALVAPAGAQQYPFGSVGAYADDCIDFAREHESGGRGYSDDAMFCLSYMRSFFDVYTSFLLRWPSCPPPELTMPAFIGTFLDWSSRNTDQWEQPVIRGIVAAITEAYPC